MTFSIEVEDIDTEDLDYRWYVNGEEQPEENTSEFIYQFIEIGNIEIEGTASDAEYTVAQTWMVQVDEVSTGESLIPEKTDLHQNFPNPFYPETVISYTLKEDSFVIIDVYNSKGQKVITLLNEQNKAGNHQISWNGSDEKGMKLSSGIYFYRMKSGTFETIRKMILAK